MKSKYIKQGATALGVGIFLALMVVVFSALFVLDEVEQAVVLQFGKPVGDPITTPGLHVKLPFIQEIRRFDKRLLTWDGDPNQIPTRGREFISVDMTARWRIADPLLLLQNVRDEQGAQSRLDDIIDSVVRDQVSSSELIEIVRSRDWSVQKSALEEMEELIVDESRDITKEVIRGRSELLEMILREARKNLPGMGIELHDVRIKRINYIPSVQRQVFSRMIAERQRVAAMFRSEGLGESAEILGETERELDEILSEAEKQAEIIRGAAEARATQIYNTAYGEDPEFYGFYRILEGYREALGKQAVLMVDGESDFMRYLKHADGSRASDSVPAGAVR